VVSALIVVAIVAVCGGLLFLLLGGAGDYGARYTAVALIGGGVGVGELVSRYRDQPLKALATFAAMGYVLINAAASAAALAAILTFGWTFGLDPQTDRDAVVAAQLLVAGFGSMALFRSSLFTVRVGDQDVGIGPSSLLSIILAACDRGVDRNRARDRAEVVGEIMRDVSFEAANGPLPTVALALMQNLDPPAQAALSVEVERLRNDGSGMSDEAKSLLLGLAVSNAIGPDVLLRAKAALGAEIIRGGTSDGREHSPEDLTELVERLAAEQVANPARAASTPAGSTGPPSTPEPDSGLTENGAREPQEAG
jgi:hypothetical protein